MRNKKIILLLISLIILSSCGGAKDALVGKKGLIRVMNF